MPGIWNPHRGIQNLRLSWITLIEAQMKTLINTPLIRSVSYVMLGVFTSVE